ncbi:hypothetical protein EVAR_81507_1 [Eumeta japonica]|uniref:Uncharacterized protein n=1 Tax=Eumeta variegata TaxID=151549 RepID=A0A4C1W2N1_EUMVA|nr:hypothetical protein EVAR_81507_1 [Eumeta japonica]
MEFFKWTLTIIDFQGLMMEPESKHRNSIMEQRILAVFGLVEIVLRFTLTMNDFQGLMMQLEAEVVDRPLLWRMGDLPAVHHADKGRRAKSRRPPPPDPRRCSNYFDSVRPPYGHCEHLYVRNKNQQERDQRTPIRERIRMAAAATRIRLRFALHYAIRYAMGALVRTQNSSEWRAERVVARRRHVRFMKTM